MTTNIKPNKIKILLVLLSFILLIGSGVLFYFIGYGKKKVEPKSFIDDEVFKIVDSLHFEKISEDKRKDMVFNAVSKYYKTLDSNSFILDKEYNNLDELGVNTLDIDQGILITDVYKNSFAQKNNIYPGNVIKGYILDGVEVLYSNQKFTTSSLANLIKNKKSTLIMQRSQFEKNNRFDVTITYDENISTHLYLSNDLNITNYNSTKYIKLNTFNEDIVKKFKNDLTEFEKNANNKSLLILDLRNNTSINIEPAIEIANMLLTKNHLAYAKLFTNSASSDLINGSLNIKKSYNIKVLINNQSQSASDLLAQVISINSDYEIIGNKQFLPTYYVSKVKSDILDNQGLDLYLTKGEIKYLKDGKYIQPSNISTKVENVSDVVEMQNFSVYDTYKINTFNWSVKNIQEFLSQNYKKIRTDGWIDQNMIDLIKQIQTDNIDKLKILKNNNTYTPDGIFDYETYKVIYDFYLSIPGSSIDPYIKSIK